MRRYLAAAVLVATVLSLPVPAAAGEPPRRFEYHAAGFYASWRERQPVSDDVYLKISWYVDVYASSEGNREDFWAGVSRYASRCERQEGRDRCRFEDRISGVLRDADDVDFLMDRDLESASFAGSFRLRTRVDREIVPVGTVDVSAALVGRGEIYRSRSSYTNWDGTCPESRYRFQERYRRAFATVSITGDFSGAVERTKSASLFEYDGRVLRRECD